MNIYSYLDNLAYNFKYSKKVFQKYINELYYNPTTSIINNKDIDYVVYKNCKFLPTEHTNSLSEAPNWIDRVEHGYTVLTLGACIGSICIPLAKEFPDVKIIAVEPLWTNELINNIRLNGLENQIEVLSDRIKPPFTGDNYIKFGSKKIKMESISLSTLLSKIPPIDYLVCDIEGDEWYFINELPNSNIKELRIEFHINRQYKKEDYWVLDKVKLYLESKKYQVDILPIHHTNPSILFKEIIYFKASKID